MAAAEEDLPRLELKSESWGIEHPSYRQIVETFGEVLVETEWGSYQGDSLFLVKKDGRFGILTFGWGSCSGCDSLEACDSQEDVNSLQDDLHRGIRWHDSVNDVVHDLDGQWAKDSYLDAEMIAVFHAAVNKATSIVVEESTPRKAVES